MLDDLAGCHGRALEPLKICPIGNYNPKSAGRGQPLDLLSRSALILLLIRTWVHAHEKKKELDETFERRGFVPSKAAAGGRPRDRQREPDRDRDRQRERDGERDRYRSQRDRGDDHRERDRDRDRDRRYSRR